MVLLLGYATYISCGKEFVKIPVIISLQGNASCIVVLKVPAIHTLHKEKIHLSIHRVR